MKYFFSLPVLLCVMCLFVCFSSCAQGKAVSSVLFRDINGSVPLYASSKEAQSGSIALSKSKEAFFSFDVPLNIPEGYSFEISYSFSGFDNTSSEDIEKMLAEWEASSSIEISFNEHQEAWILPVSLRALRIDNASVLPSLISYTIPVSPRSIDSIAINVKNNASFFSRTKLILELKSFKIIPRWYGIAWEEDQLKITPFVYLDETSGVTIAAINPPEQFWLDYPEISVSDFEAVPDSVNNIRNNYIKIGGREYSPEAGQKEWYFNRQIDQSRPIEVCCSSLRSFVLQSSENRAYSLNPITQSPGSAVAYNRNQWRMEEYEIFRWNQFPEILIFDTANYRVQDRLVKRLAFFVEKAGFEGTLSTDEEIAHLHGWNAHDYRAEDLARFFETARITQFPLNKEELELKQILLDQHIILQNADDSIVPGYGAIVSISRESAEYLRYLFIVHECYHGLYFIDKEFEDFCRLRWRNFDPIGKAFVTAYFASQRYDTQNEYLMANELMAYCLQHTVNNAGIYFGETLARRIHANPEYRHLLPLRDRASNSWPYITELFTEETIAFSEYVNMRWGLRAGTLTKNR